MELTSVYSTYRSSRIDPIASRAPRYMELSYDGSYERYVINKIDIKLDKTARVTSASLRSEASGYATLTYAVLGYKN
jgi:hypothetical protein